MALREVTFVIGLFALLRSFSPRLCTVAAFLWLSAALLILLCRTARAWIIRLDLLTGYLRLCLCCTGNPNECLTIDIGLKCMARNIAIQWIQLVHVG